MSHVAKNFEKNLLYDVGDVGRIVQQAQSEIIDGLLEARQKCLVGSFGAFL
jgi:hypothetical protein